MVIVLHRDMHVEAKRKIICNGRQRGKKLSYLFSPTPHTGSYAPIAQMDRVPPSEGGGHTFESCWARHYSIRTASITMLLQYPWLTDCIYSSKDHDEPMRHIVLPGRSFSGFPEKIAIEKIRAYRKV